MTWDKQTIQKARKLNLPKILMALKYPLRKLEQENYNIENLAGVVIKESYWYDKISQKGGNTIDFFINFKKQSFSDTMKLLEKYIQ